MTEPFVTPFDGSTTADEVLKGVYLAGRRYIVTGGASGIGMATAQALTRAGAEVIVATRRPAGRERELDLSDLDSVRAFVHGWDGPLNGIVAGGGVMALPTRETAKNGWEMQLATNFLGHFALVTGLHENLRAAGESRVVVVSSGIQAKGGFDFDDPQFERQPYDPWKAYRNSKVAGSLFAVALARRWAADGVLANTADPGYVATNLQRHLDEDTLRAFGMAGDNPRLPDYFSTPDQAAATNVLLAAYPLPKEVSGRYFIYCQEAERVPGGPEASGGVAPWSLDPAAADRLWELAENAL
ncbi:SDR family NAD(P)-dependent oxidoreductase [Actinoplanes sp. NPDC048796]|uniref:SDR family NAD(P)-dependent oxidoreductase n=1 Tax=unclassified Actinoplanes TaxID=2626549 RepID=UPI0033F55CAC